MSVKKLLFIIVFAISAFFLLSLSQGTTQDKTRYYCELVWDYGIDRRTETVINNVVLLFNNDSYKLVWGEWKINSSYLLVKQNGRKMYNINEAVNYMSSQKWTLLQVYTDDKLGLTHFIMYKDAKNEQEALNNIWIADRRYMENEAYIAQPPISLNAELGYDSDDEE